MDKKFPFFCMLIPLLCLVINVRSQISFELNYGGDQYESGSGVLETPDQGFLILGITKSFSIDNASDTYLIKTDASGDTLWTKTYGGELEDAGIAIEYASDDGYILAVASNSIHPGNYDIHIIKINDAGDTLWTRTYGGPETDYPHSLRSTADGGYIILAHTLSYGMGSLDLYLLKLDQNGDSLWAKTYGGAGSDWGSSVQQTDDGGYILTGDTYSFGDPKGDMYLVKTNSAGDTLWTRTYGGTEYDRAYHVFQTQDLGYLLSGVTESFGVSGQHGYLVKTDEAGDTLWTKVLGGAYSGRMTRTLQTSDGKYIAVGELSTDEADNTDVFLVKLDADGSIIWTKNFGGSGYESISDMRATSDKGLIMTGNTNSNTVDQNKDVYLLKTFDPDTLTNLDNLPNRAYEAIVLHNYPNPFHSSTQISFTLSKPDPVTLTLYDPLGRKIETLLNAYMNEGTHTLIWNAKDYPDGIYICHLEAGLHVSTLKISHQNMDRGRWQR